ncbi:hypothetical protein MUP00_01305 [Candidatus Bathyarchaeota archaeon]|jgi:riboflavin transporter FmnP|nr:hypothetical protein [Candidatus Bathyarchaeota archaeon]
MARTRSVALISVFATLTAVLDTLPGLPQLSSGVWYRWVFVATPLAGIALDPAESFLSVFLGVMISHAVILSDPYEYFFALGAPLGAAVTSLVFRERTRSVLAYYATLLAAYLFSPPAGNLPLWALWDTFTAFVVLIAVVLSRRESYRLANGRLALVFSTLIGLEADILFRVFIFVPLGTYDWLYGFSLSFVRDVWIVSALITPIQVGIALVSSLLAGTTIRTVTRGLMSNCSS